MKIGKKIIPIVVICSMLFLAAISVAIDENETITDSAGDVTTIDFFGLGGEIGSVIITYIACFP